MQNEFGDDEHFDDDELLICDDRGSNNIEEYSGLTSILFCVDFGAVMEL